MDDISRLWGNKIAEIERNSNKNHTSMILRKMTLLKVNGITIGDVLCKMGIHKIKIYGFGKIGQEVLNGLRGKVEICGIYDKNALGISIEREFKSKLFLPEELEFEEVPILITPSALFQRLSYEFIQKGMDRNKILAVNTVLTFGIEMLKGHDYVEKYKKGEKQFLITGAQFTNKGAQAMLFVTINEIKKRFPNAIIWYQPVDDFKKYTPEIQEKYKFLFVLDEMDLRSQVFEIVPLLTAIIDISGYALASHWENEWYMQTLRIAYNYDIPLFLMPQSYGPFDFSEEKATELRKLLQYAKKIYTREKQAYEFFQTEYQLENIELSKDLVLQNRGIERKHIYFNKSNEIFVSKVQPHSVGIVPNMQCYHFGTMEETLLLNKSVIDTLLLYEREIYIVAHSDDQEVCRDIYTMYRNNPRVHLCVEELDCMQFSKYISNFDYLIASRFHAIVHAYKENVPCIAIGWAEKYKELLKSFGQEQYVFDVRERINVSALKAAIEQMNANYKKEKKVIQEILPERQKGNCFVVLEELRIC